MIQKLLSTAALLACLTLPVQARDQFGDLAQLDILPGWTQADGTRVVGLRLRLPQGWKTYWRAPGDAGIPPVIDWSGSRNLRRLQPQWPTPEVFSQNGMRSVGYREELVLPVILTPKQSGQPVTLKGRLQVGLCKDICVPAELDFDVAVPESAGTRSPDIIAALIDQPLPGRDAGLGQVHCQLSATQDGMRLQADLDLPTTGGREFAVVETGNPDIWVAEAKSKRQGHHLHIETELMHMEGQAFALDRSGIRITVLGSDFAVDIQGCSKPG